MDLKIANVVEMKYRMTISFEQLQPKINIIIAWLLLFAGSLDYQLNPHLYTESFKSEKKLSYIQYNNGAFFEARNKLEQLLAKYFEKVLKLLIYSYNYQFT